jgi:hypothetical protein
MSDIATTLIFRSSGTPGYSQALRDAPHRVLARKRSLPVQVKFIQKDCVIQTLEGAVHARAGDAIVTGAGGEQWPVASTHFSSKYSPVAPCRSGVEGVYQSLPIVILALHMNRSFSVVLSDGQSHLAGQKGDWLVDYGDGTLGIVAPTIFDNTYDITESG